MISHFSGACRIDSPSVASDQLLGFLLDTFCERRMRFAPPFGSCRRSFLFCECCKRFVSCSGSCRKLCKCPKRFAVCCGPGRWFSDCLHAFASWTLAEEFRRKSHPVRFLLRLSQMACLLFGLLLEFWPWQTAPLLGASLDWLLGASPGPYWAPGPLGWAWPGRTGPSPGRGQARPQSKTGAPVRTPREPPRKRAPARTCARPRCAVRN
jgi:hypothetical protein